MVTRKEGVSSPAVYTDHVAGFADEALAVELEQIAPLHDPEDFGLGMAVQRRPEAGVLVVSMTASAPPENTRRQAHAQVETDGRDRLFVVLGTPEAERHFDCLSNASDDQAL